MAESKIVDKRNQDELGEYGIAFAARKKDGLFDAGHAFMVWYFSDPANNRTTYRAVGFYPSGTMYDVVVNGSGGQVLEDSDSEIAKQLIVLISKPAFDSALAVESQYSDATYTLGFNDCTTFVESVAGKFLVCKSQIG